MKNVLILVSMVSVVVGCSGETADDGTGTDGVSGESDEASSDTVGARCGDDRDCDAPQACKTDFPYERSVCTVTCEADTDCSGDAVCVDGLTDYNSQPIAESYCLLPCVVDADCSGSVCDDRPAGEGYCF